ncbi:hypothetical protein FRC07_007134 [Ceratobasidium sp. 392]|nr:hypothetical protein FRC07_007134 [Ceratobasidium sp. 392]
MFWNNPSLVGKLKSVKLLLLAGFFTILQASYNKQEEDWSYSGLAADPQPLLAVLAERSPNIQHIWLRTLGANSIRATFATPVTALDTVQQLPLQTLHLEGIWLVRRVDVIEYLTTTFSMLQELGLPNHIIQFVDLARIQAKMPKLRVLSVSISPESLTPDLVPQMAPMYGRQSPFRTLEANFLGERIYCRGYESQAQPVGLMTYSEAIELTLYLFSLWPDVQLEEKLDYTREKNILTARRRLELINDHLAMLSFCNRDGTKMYKDVKVLNPQSWNSVE